MHVDPAPATYVGAILTAVRSFDQARVLAALDDADATHGLDITIDEIVFPSLRVVGTFWSSGTIDVAHEHLLSM
ncbi:MAG: B12-binding domain-containing protein, partial [Janthinobacterium lividum]